jgi:hypothetical protein
LTISASRSTRGGWSGSRIPTGRARPRRCGCCSGRSPRRASLHDRRPRVHRPRRTGSARSASYSRHALPRRAHRTRPPAGPRHRGTHRAPSRRGARARRSRRGGRPARRRVLAWHDPEPRVGRRAARRPARADPRRAHRRPRPLASAGCATSHTTRGAGTHDRPVQPRAGRSRPDRRRGPHPRSRPPTRAPHDRRHRIARRHLPRASRPAAQHRLQRLHQLAIGGEPDSTEASDARTGSRRQSNMPPVHFLPRSGIFCGTPSALAAPLLSQARGSEITPAKPSWCTLASRD